MKLVFSVAFLAAFLTVASAIDEKYKKARRECDLDPATNVETAVIDRIKAGTGTDEDKLAAGRNLLCVNVKLGFQKANGDYETDNLRKRLEEDGVDKTKIDEVMAACGTRPAGTSAEKAAGLLLKCFSENVHKE